MNIHKIVVGAVMTNCYVVSEGQDAIIIDPGANAEGIAEYIRGQELCTRAILLTHGHFDHILAANRLREEFGAKVYCLDEERELVSDPGLNAAEIFRFHGAVVPDEVFRDGQTLSFGSLNCRVIATPGHTRGGACFYFEQEGVLFSGDTLFFESVGRTDLPTGNASALLSSLREKLFVLPRQVKVYSGHGPATSIGYEKENNPYAAEGGYFD